MTVNSRKPSLFLPVILIGAGVTLLLRNLGFLPAFNWGVLLNLWPLALVVLGLDMMFGHKSPWVGGLIGLLTVGAVVAFLYFSPALGFNPPEDVKTDVVSEPLGNTERVEYYFDTASPPVTLRAASGSSDLIKATLVHRGQVNFSVQGEEQKTVRLSTSSSPGSWFSFNTAFNERRWEVALAPGLPTTIHLNGGSGALDLDLDGIALEALWADLGSGASSFNLPVSNTPYEAAINSGSGAVSLELPENTDVSLSIDSGSGAVTVRLPRSSGVKIEVLDTGSGSVRIPGKFQAIGLNQGAESGSWQSANFAGAAHTITIRVTGRGSGSINFELK